MNKKATPQQMLDAAHGKTYRPADELPWPHLPVLEVETRGIEVVGTRRGR